MGRMDRSGLFEQYRLARNSTAANPSVKRCSAKRFDCCGRRSPCDGRYCRRAGPIHLGNAGSPGRRRSDPLLRDNVEENLAAGRKLAAAAGLKKVHSNSAMLSTKIARRPSSRRRIWPSFRGSTNCFPITSRCAVPCAGWRAVRPGGYLVYTCQPWHPQVEMIARVLTNRKGRPWIMRRRTQAEMDDWSAKRVSKKIAQEIDPWGIFTVSLARRAVRETAGDCPRFAESAEQDGDCPLRPSGSARALVT